MDAETKGKLIAWEAIAREAFKLLTPEQRQQVLASTNAICHRQRDDIAGAASTVWKSMR